MLIANLWIGLVAARTLAYLTPALALVCGWGLWLIRLAARALFAALLAILSLASDPVIQPRMDVDAAARSLAAQASPGDLVILETGWDDNAFEYELSLALPDGVQTVRTLPWTGDPGQAVPVVPQVEDRVRAHRRVWVVQWLQPSQVIPWLEAGDAGYLKTIERTTPTGAQYAIAYPDDPAIRTVLFGGPTTGDPLVFGRRWRCTTPCCRTRFGPEAPARRSVVGGAVRALDFGGRLLLDGEGRVVAGTTGRRRRADHGLGGGRHGIRPPHAGAARRPAAQHVPGDGQRLLVWRPEPLRVNGEAAAAVEQVTVASEREHTRMERPSNDVLAGPADPGGPHGDRARAGDHPDRRRPHPERQGLPQMFYLLQGTFARRCRRQLPLWIAPVHHLPLIGNPHAGFFYPGMWAVWPIGEIARHRPDDGPAHLAGRVGHGAAGAEFGASRTGRWRRGLRHQRVGGGGSSRHFHHVMVFGWAGLSPPARPGARVVVCRPAGHGRVRAGAAGRVHAANGLSQLGLAFGGVSRRETRTRSGLGGRRLRLGAIVPAARSWRGRWSCPRRS